MPYFATMAYQETKECSVGVVGFRNQLDIDFVMPVRYVHNTRANGASANLSATRFEAYIKDTHDAHMTVNGGWDAWMDRHIGINAYNCSLDSYMRKMIDRDAPFHAHTRSGESGANIPKDHLWTTGNSGEGVEFRGNLLGELQVGRRSRSRRGGWWSCGGWGSRAGFCRWWDTGRGRRRRQRRRRCDASARWWLRGTTADRTHLANERKATVRRHSYDPVVRPLVLLVFVLVVADVLRVLRLVHVGYRAQEALLLLAGQVLPNVRRRPQQLRGRRHRLQDAARDAQHVRLLAGGPPVEEGADGAADDPRVRRSIRAPQVVNLLTAQVARPVQPTQPTTAWATQDERHCAPQPPGF